MSFMVSISAPLLKILNIHTTLIPNRSTVPIVLFLTMKETLPNTLATRISFLREKLNLSREKLAEISNIELATIYEIEEGRDIFLSPGIRQRLSKALRVPAGTLKEVEIQPQQKEIPADVIEMIKTNILAGNLTSNYCPECKSLLNCKVVTMYDLEDNPVRHPKASCSKCPFQIK